MRSLNSEGGHFVRRRKRRKGRRRRRSNSEEADPLPVVLGTLLEGGGTGTLKKQGISEKEASA